METITSIKNYMVESYQYIVNEAWQLGADAKSEAYNIYSDLVTNTSDVIVDLQTTSYWEVTEGEKKTENENNEDKATDVDQITFLNGEKLREKDQAKVEIFAVEAYSNSSAPAIINVGKEENKLVAEDSKKSESNF